MTRDEVIAKAKAIGWHAQECSDPNIVAIRVYKSETNEAMRLGANGALYMRGDDGWMWQLGTVEDAANAIRFRGEA